MDAAALWTFPFTATGGARLTDPPGFRAVSEKVVDEEVSKALERARVFSSEGDHSLEARRSAQQAYAAMVRQAWDLSWLPVKSLGPNLVMLYFAGSSSNIFTVLIIGYALVNAISTLLRVNSIFLPLETTMEQTTGRKSVALGPKAQQQRRSAYATRFLPQKTVFVILALALTGYMIYYAGKLGILPLDPASYTARPPVKIMPNNYAASLL